VGRRGLGINSGGRNGEQPGQSHGPRPPHVPSHV
jgi:hypothetical protein